MTRPMPIAQVFLFAASGAHRLCVAFVPENHAHAHIASRSVAVGKIDKVASSLAMSKNSDRARMEKTLEDLMDNDWREFRAKLVLKESYEAERQDRRRPVLSPVVPDEALARQERLGTLFDRMIHSVLPQQHQQSTQRSFGDFGIRPRDRIEDYDLPASSIFDGDAVGGATPSSILPEGCQDPFASPAELPVHMQIESVKLDKHRWAHPIPHIEPGCVLVANERLGGVFHQTIVLIIDHHESAGTTGIVINRPMPGKLLRVASEYPSNVDLSLKLAFNNADVTYGGPVMQEEYSILHSYGEVEGSKKVAMGVFVGGSEALMNEVRRNNFDPRNALFVKGHAAWVPGQLIREISKKVWYPASVSADFVLRYAGAAVVDGDNGDDLWLDILSCMGGYYADIARQYARRGDNRMMP